jgi:hypothetical protein
LSIYGVRKENLADTMALAYFVVWNWESLGNTVFLGAEAPFDHVVLFVWLGHP